jgi:integrase
MLDEDCELIFSTRVGTSVNPENLINRSFKPLLKKAGLPEIRFHNLRCHTTCATLLLGRGVHPKKPVQELLLGHDATIAMTFLDTYSHYLTSMGDQAGGAMGGHTRIIG